jgi:hypothetical protein
MVNMPQDSVQNPFQAWLNYDDSGSFGNHVASVALRDIQWSESFLARIWKKIVAAQLWSGVFRRSIFVFAQERLLAAALPGGCSEVVFLFFCFDR